MISDSKLQIEPSAEQQQHQHQHSPITITKSGGDSGVIENGSRVSVVWVETGSMFAGTVQNVHMELSTCDVLYDEQVYGKPCIEKEVCLSRVLLMSADDYWVDNLFISAANSGAFDNPSAGSTPTANASVRPSPLRSMYAMQHQKSKLIVDLLDSDTPQDQVFRSSGKAANGNDDNNDGDDDDEDDDSKAADGDGAEDFRLSNSETVMLHYALTSTKLMQLLCTSQERSEWIADLLNVRLLSNLDLEEQRREIHAAEVGEEQRSAPSLAVLWISQENPVDSMSKMRDWLKAISTDDASPLQLLRGSISALAAAVRLQTAANVLQRRSHSHLATNTAEPITITAAFISSLTVPEDLMVQVLHQLLVFLDSTFLNPLSASSHASSSFQHGSVSAESPSNKTAAAQKLALTKSVNQTKKSQRSKIMNLLPHALCEVCKAVSAPLASLLNALEALVGEARQSDRLIATACDVSFAVLKLDPAVHASIEMLALHYPSDFNSLQMAASRLLRKIFQVYANHRQGIMVSNLTVLSQAYSVKTPTKSFALHRSAHTETSTAASAQLQSMLKKQRKSIAVFNSGQRNASIGFITLLCCIQGAVNYQAFNTTTTTAADTAVLSELQLKKKKATKNLSAAASNKSKKPTVPVSDEGNTDDPLDQTTIAFLRDCCQCASFFVVELLKRCVHKEVSTEYRSVAMHLAQELMNVLQVPDWPASSILLEQFVLRITNCVQSPEVLQQYSDAMSGAGATTGGRKDMSMPMFLLDLLGVLGVHLRELSLTSEREHAATEELQFTPLLRGIIRRKLAVVKSTWSSTDIDAADADSDSGEQQTTPIAGAAQQTKKRKSVATSDESLKKYDAFEGLEILFDVSQTAMEVVADQPLHACYEHGNARNSIDQSSDSAVMVPVAVDDYDKAKWDSAALVPSPLAILDQVGQHNALIKRLPELTEMDFYYHYLSIFLLNKFADSLPSSDTIANSAEERAWENLGSHLEQSDDCLKDAYMTLMAFWQQESWHKRRLEVSRYAFIAMQVVASSEQGQQSRLQHDAHTERSVLKNGLFELFHTRKLTFRTTTHFWARHACLIEESLAANRHVVNIRLMRACFERLLNEILFKSNDIVPAVRARVIKTLSMFLQADADLVLREQVRNVVTSRLMDRAISVREESVKLIGNYAVASGSSSVTMSTTSASVASVAATGRGAEAVEILRQRSVQSERVRTMQGLPEGYLEGLKARLNDEGISVRKSVVCLFRDILLSQPEHPQFIQLCISLLEKLSHPKEEESIKEMIRSTLQHIFFLPPSLELLRTAEERKRRNNSAKLLLSASMIADTAQDAQKGLQMTPRESKSADESNSVTTGDLQQFTSDLAIINDVTPDGETPHQQQQFNSADGQSMRSQLSATSKSSSMVALMQQHVESTALQLVEMASSSATQGMISQNAAVAENAMHEWIISLLREVLHGSSEGDEQQRQTKQRRSACFEYCKNIVKNLVEQLLRAEERDEALLRVLQQKSNSNPKRHVVNLIATIALFCEAHPPFIADHLSTLLPYLKRDASFEMAETSFISLKVTEILSSISVLSDFRIRCDITEVLNDLSNIALNYSGKNIKAAIRCISLLTANVCLDAAHLFQLADKCYTAIYSVVALKIHRERSGLANSEPFTAAQIGKLQRCLIVLGYICEFSPLCSKEMQSLGSVFNSVHREMIDNTSALSAVYLSDDMNIRIAELSVEYISFLHPCAMYGACYSAAKFVLETNDNSNVHLQAVQAIGGVFTGYPRIMILANETKLLSALLGDDFNDRVHERFLLALKDMLISEEARTEKTAALNLMKESGVAVAPIRDGVLGNPEQDSDATIAGFQLQQHRNALLKFFNHRSASLRYTTLLLIGTLLRQGMLCPLDVIGELVALQCDAVEIIRSEALRMLQIEDEKHANFLNSRMVKGVEKGYIQQWNIRSGEKNTSSETTVATADQSSMVLDIAIVAESAVSTAAAGGIWTSTVSVFGPLYLSCIQQFKRRRNQFLNGLLHRCCQIFDTPKEKILGHPASFESAQQQQRVVRDAEVAATTAAASAISVAAGLVEKGKPGAKEKALQQMKQTTALIAKKPTKGKVDYTTDMKTTFQSLDIAYFLCTTIAYLPFIMWEEPLQVIHFINRNISVTASLQLQKIKLLLLAMGCEFRVAGGMQPPVLGTRLQTSDVGAAATTTIVMRRTSSVDSAALHDELEADLLTNDQKIGAWFHSAAATVVYVRICELLITAAELRSFEAVVRLKSFMKKAYQLSDDRCAAFNPDDKASAASSDTVAVERFQGMEAPLFNAQPPTVPRFGDTFSPQLLAAFGAWQKKADAPWESVGADVDSAVRNLILAVCMDYNRISCLLNNDPEDFTFTGNSKLNRRRKSTAAAATAVGTGGAPASTGSSTSGAAQSKVRQRGDAKKKAAAAAASKKRKRSNRDFVDSDDDDDDDDEEEEDSDAFNDSDDDSDIDRGSKRIVPHSDSEMSKSPTRKQLKKPAKKTTKTVTATRVPPSLSSSAASTPRRKAAMVAVAKVRRYAVEDTLLTAASDDDSISANVVAIGAINSLDTAEEGDEDDSAAGEDQTGSSYF